MNDFSQTRTRKSKASKKTKKLTVPSFYDSDEHFSDASSSMSGHESAPPVPFTSRE